MITAEQLIKKGGEYGLQKGVEAGRQEGRREGPLEGQRQMIRSMIEHGMTATEVARLSGLSLDEVQSLLQTGT